jgi:hypothetical protein
MTSKLLIAASVVAFAVPSAAIAVDKIAGVDQSGIATQPAKTRVKPHNHNEFHKQGAPAADVLPVVAAPAKPLHDHGKTHKQQ